MTIDKCTVIRSPYRKLAVVLTEPKTLIQYGRCKLCMKQLTEKNNSSLTLYSASNFYTHVSIQKFGSLVDVSAMGGILADLKIKDSKTDKNTDGVIILSQGKPVYFDIDCGNTIIYELDKHLCTMDNKLKASNYNDIDEETRQILKI